MLVYLDSGIVIDLVENRDGWSVQTATRINDLRRSGDELVVSDLTRIECRVGPLVNGNPVLLADFDAFFSALDLTVLSLTRAICDLATEIRATEGFKIPDALHLAAAVESGCDLFLTRDSQLSRFRDVTVEVLA